MKAGFFSIIKQTNVIVYAIKKGYRQKQLLVIINFYNGSEDYLIVWPHDNDATTDCLVSCL